MRYVRKIQQKSQRITAQKEQKHEYHKKKTDISLLNELFSVLFFFLSTVNTSEKLKLKKYIGMLKTVNMYTFTQIYKKMYMYNRE